MLNVYLSGEIHSNWRDEIIQLCQNEKLEISFSSPITNHDASDNCGVDILGPEENNFWKEKDSNTIRDRLLIPQVLFICTSSKQVQTPPPPPYIFLKLIHKFNQPPPDPLKFSSS